MKNVFKYSFKIKFTFLIFAGLVLISVFVYIWFSRTKDTNAAMILGSLFAGLIVAIIQFLISWQDYSSTEKLKELRINEVLFNRDKRDFYEDYIRSAKKNIDMIGVTSSRFMEHFANDDENSPENSKVLLMVMSKGVKVRILVPKNEYLFTENEKRNERNANERFLKILQRYPENFSVKYFSHVPAHSVFKIDDECIVGPVFPEISSKYTPALYLKNKSPFAEKYLNYFNYEWDRAESL